VDGNDYDDEDDDDQIDINSLPNDQMQYFINNGGDDDDDEDHECNSNIKFNEDDCEEASTHTNDDDLGDELFALYQNLDDSTDFANFQGIHVLQLVEQDQREGDEEEDRYSCP
jgi:hypothetical protein